MGIEPYLVCSSVIGIMAQRLVRAICPQCKMSYTPGEEERRVFTSSRLTYGGDSLCRGRGCPDCINTGYRGRTGIFELMTIDDELRELVMANPRSTMMKQAVVKKGMHTLRDDGMRKVLAGDTTIEEVLRVTQDDVA